MMKSYKVIGLLMLILISASASVIDPDNVYTNLISYEQDIDRATLIYEYCNPFNETISLENVLKNDYYSYIGAENIPDMDDAIILIEKDVTTQIANPIEAPESDKDPLPAITYRSVTTKEYMNVEKGDSLEANACIKVKHTAFSEPRYGEKAVIDIVPYSNYSAITLTDEKSLQDREDSSSLVNQYDWILWTVTWRYRQQLNASNPTKYNYTALPLDYTIVDNRIANDGSDLRLICNGSQQEFGMRKIGIDTWQIESLFKIDGFDTNDSCYVYWGADMVVTPAGMEWREIDELYEISLNLSAITLSDYFVVGGSWIVVNPGGTDAPDGTVIEANTAGNNYLIYQDEFVVPVLIDVQGRRNLANDFGVFIGKDDTALDYDNAFEANFDRFGTTANGNITYRHYDAASSLVYSNQFPFISSTSVWFNHWTYWHSNDSHTTIYRMNGDFHTNVTDGNTSFKKGYAGFRSERTNEFSLFNVLQICEFCTLNSTDGIEEGEYPQNVTLPIGNASNVDIDWGVPGAQYCVDDELQNEWTVVINGLAYVKVDKIRCEYGCYADKCRTSPEIEIVIIFFVVIIDLIILIRSIKYFR